MAKTSTTPRKAAPRKAPAAPVEHTAPSSRAQRAEPKSGELVTFTYQDAADNDVVRTGLVVRTTDEHDPGGPRGAIVAWLSDFSDPIPFDQLAQVK